MVLKGKQDEKLCLYYLLVIYVQFNSFHLTTIFVSPSTNHFGLLTCHLRSFKMSETGNSIPDHFIFLTDLQLKTLESQFFGIKSAFMKTEQTLYFLCCKVTIIYIYQETNILFIWHN